MSSKHFLTDPTHLVQSALRALTYTNPAVALDAENKIIYLRPSPNATPTVSLISGGGSGHEPSFSAFVGHGLLSAAVAGTIFASPGASQIREAIVSRVETGKGVLVIVMNYTGDVLNFGMGVEKAKALGLDVRMVVVGDDVGVGRKRGGKVGRRGIAGTCLVHKIAGALAAMGEGIEGVERVARLASENLVSIGASLSHVHVPGRSVEEATEGALAHDEVEIGMGIHNEEGSEKVKADLPGMVKTMLAHMLDQNDEDRAFVKITPEDKTVLMVNNLGGVSVLELGGITNEVVQQLESDWNIKPVRTLAGTYMTSLNGLGFSITLLKLEDTGLGQGKSMLELLDAPAEASGWMAAVQTKTWDERNTATREKPAGSGNEQVASNLQIDPSQAVKAVTAGIERLIKAEPDVTNYDTIVGDGDCGIGLRRGGEAILKMFQRGSRQPDDAAVFMHNIIGVVETTMDGTSGALYAIFLNSLAHAIRQQSPQCPTPITVQIWAQALGSSLDALGKYTPARPGDRTLIDALYPFVETLKKTSNVKEAALAAAAGAKHTQGMRASLGRTVYVGGEGWQGVPDPGAYGLAEFLQGLSEGLL